MKKVVCLTLAFLLAVSLCACGKEAESTEPSEQAVSEEEKVEAEKKAAIALYDNGDYAEALVAFRSMEKTDEINKYIKNCGYQILADYIFKNGTQGNELGSLGEGSEEGYYIEDSGLILFVKPNATGFDYIEFVNIEFSNTTAPDSFFYLKLQDSKDTFWYERYIGVPANFWHTADIQIDTYTRDTGVSFELGYTTTNPPSFSTTEEEMNNTVRDSCNDLLDSVAVILRRLDCGISLADLGFVSYK